MSQSRPSTIPCSQHMTIPAARAMEPAWSAWIHRGPDPPCPTTTVTTGIGNGFCWTEKKPTNTHLPHGTFLSHLRLPMRQGRHDCGVGSRQTRRRPALDCPSSSSRHSLPSLTHLPSTRHTSGLSTCVGGAYQQNQPSGELERK